MNENAVRGRWAPTFALLVATGLLSGCGGASTGGDSADNGGSQSIPSSMLSEGGTQQLPPATEHSIDELGYDLGAPEAPIKIVEFSDFGCGYCRRFHTEIFPALQREWIESGKVQWKYVTYVSGMFPNGLQAAFAAECVGEQGRFQDMSAILYERQQDWKGKDDPYSIFAEYVEELGLDGATYQSCLSENRQRSRVRSGVLTGARLGVRGTPSFLVDGFPLVGAQPVEVWNDILTARMNELESAGQD